MATYDAGLAGGAVLRLTVDLASQNVNGNYSVVNWALYLVKGTYTSWTATAIGWSVSINGAGYSGGYTFDFRSSSQVTIAAGSTQINHNADGTASVGVFGHTNATGTSTGGPADTGGAYTLPTIPRASSASFTNPMVAGNSYPITISRASSSFTHTVQVFFGSYSATLATGVATSYTYAVPMSMLTNIPNAPSGTGFIRIITYNGATQIGYKDISLTISAPASVVPTFTGITDSDSVTAIATLIGQYVQGMSRPTLGITGAAGVYGSTIRSYSITVDGQTVTSATGTIANPLTSSGTLTITAVVTDTRGRTATQTKNITVLAYSPPLINSATTQRSTLSGTPAEEGTYIRVNLNAVSSSLLAGAVQKNKLIYKISVRPRGGTVWTLKKTVTVPGSAITFNGFDTVGTYAIEDSWEVLVEVSDQFNTSSVQSTIATAKIFMHWGGQGEGLGIGKFWERGAVDILGQAYQNDGAKIIDEVNILSKQAVLGTVDPFWTAGLPKVTLDSTGTLSTSGFMWDRGTTGNWRPTPGQRVYLTPSAVGGYIISGPIAESNILMNAVPITSWFATAGIYSGTSWHLPSVSLTTDGIIQMQGLWKFTTSPGAVDTKFAQLPDSRFYPDKQFTFTTSGNNTITRIQVRTDGSMWYINSASGNAAGQYFSLSNIRYPAAGVATWTPILPFGSSGGPTWGASTITGIAYFWIDAYGLIWLSGSYGSSVAITTDNVAVIVPNGAWTIAYQQHIVTSKTGGVGVGFGAMASSATPANVLVHKGTVSTLSTSDSVHLDGIIIRSTLADTSLLTWVSPILVNSWANYDTAVYAPMALAYRGDLIFERGFVRNGTAITATITTIPVGQRPVGQDTNAIIFPAWSNNGVGRLDMGSGGDLHPLVGSTTWFSLDNHTWVPEQ